LILDSDGVYEIDRTDGSMWKYQEFVDHVSALPRQDSAEEQMLGHVRQLDGSDVLADDFSFLEVWL
jgi:sigma-B regulation protein RsbU (phosphoserine phosphatase)